MKNLENIKNILDSDAGMIINKTSQEIDKDLIDNRFNLIKNNIELIENKDDHFYSELIKLLGTYVDQLYDKRVIDLPKNILDENGCAITQDNDEFDSIDMFYLTGANRILSEDLFEYICNILESNKDIKLDIETLKTLFNRNPKLFSLTVEEDYLCRLFNYERLANILNKNQTLEKSNITIDDIYQLLLDTCQINNPDVFGVLVKKEQFNDNHQKIDEILTWCNGKTFIEITNIIRCNFDKDFDRLSIIKGRNKKKFCESLIALLINRYGYDKDYNLIHQILTDSEIKIDYNEYFSDYTGQTDLKSIIALSKNQIIVKDLLSNEQNIQNSYWHGDSKIRLYRLYAIIGDYEHALTNFDEAYNFRHDLDDEDDNFDKFGYAYGSWGYEDSLSRFIEDICTSLNNENIEYQIRKNIINHIIYSDKVQFINLEETLPILKEVLSNEDFKVLFDNLLLKQSNGNLNFVTATENNDYILDHYMIKIANDEEVKNILSSFNNDKSPKVLVLNHSKKDE